MEVIVSLICMDLESDVTLVASAVVRVEWLCEHAVVSIHQDDLVVSVLSKKLVTNDQRHHIVRAIRQELLIISLAELPKFQITTKVLLCILFFPLCNEPGVFSVDGQVKGGLLLQINARLLLEGGRGKVFELLIIWNESYLSGNGVENFLFLFLLVGILGFTAGWRGIFAV